MGKKKKKVIKYSGIGGQAVLEGVMMKNAEKYAVAVRKPDGDIEVDVENFQGALHGSKIKELPLIRGVFNFIDSMTLGTKTLNYSASFYEDEDAKDHLSDKALDKLTGGRAEKVMSFMITLVAVCLAVGLFIVLPYYISSKIESYVRNASLMAIIEGGIRIGIFVLYVLLISLMKDIKRLFMYHGAEHKCINCIERGRPLTVSNVMRSSRLHKRCGTSFIFFVMVVSIILFFFIRVDNTVYRLLLRLALIPVIAGISYEFIRIAGRSNNIIIRILSLPGLLIQRITTKEPTKDMVEVAIASVEAVFDWKSFMAENFPEKWERYQTEEALASQNVSESDEVEVAMQENAGASHDDEQSQIDVENGTDASTAGAGIDSEHSHVDNEES